MLCLSWVTWIIKEAEKPWWADLKDPSVSSLQFQDDQLLGTQEKQSGAMTQTMNLESDPNSNPDSAPYSLVRQASE